MQKSSTFATAKEKQLLVNAQMAESVDALVSNTSGFTSIPVRPRVWVPKREFRCCKKILSCPDGGIGRRAGLKHQWIHFHPGSTPGLGTKKERVFRTFSFFVMCLLFLYLSGSLKSFIFAFRENYSSFSIQLVVSSWFIIFFIICAEITSHDVE